MFQFRKIRFMTAFACVMVLLVFIFTLVMLRAGNEMEKNIEKNLEQQISDLSSRQADIFYNIYKVSRSMLANTIYDSDISAILSSDGDPSPRDIRTIQSKLRYFDSYYLSGLPYRVTLFDLKGNIFSTWMRSGFEWEEFVGLAQVKQALAQNTSFFTIRHKLWCEPEEDTSTRIQVFSFANLVQEQYGSKAIGVLLLTISEEDLLAGLEKEQNQIGLLSSSTGEYFYGSANEELCLYVAAHPELFASGNLASLTWEDRKYLVSFTDMSSMNMNMVQVLDYRIAYAELINYQRTNAAALLGSVLLMAVLSGMIILGLSMPLNSLFKQVKSIHPGESAHTPVVVKGYRECDAIALAVNDLCKRTEDMLVQIKQEQQTKAELHYQYLVNQLDPHFVLNTLNNIKWIAYMNKANKVAEMISALGFLLETSLGKSTGPVTIGYELDYIKRYMFLQELRYKDTLSFECHVDEAYLDIPIEKFTLQLLVGNAIKHGYKKGKPLHIVIRITCEQGNVILNVSDNGKGMSAQRRQTVQEWIDFPDKKDEKEHLGLTNISRRLKYLYGDRARILIRSSLRIGTEVTVMFPADASMENVDV